MEQTEFEDFVRSEIDTIMFSMEDTATAVTALNSRTDFLEAQCQYAVSSAEQVRSRNDEVYGLMQSIPDTYLPSCRVRTLRINGKQCGRVFIADDYIDIQIDRRPPAYIETLF